MWRAAAALVGFVAAAAATPTLAVPSQYDIAFVSEFADACVPQRMSYPGTKETALAAGWTEVQRTAHPELDGMMALSEAAMQAPDLIDPRIEYAMFSKAIQNAPHFLVVSRSSALIEKGGDRWTYVGCYLYNFDAAAPIDPEPVTALIGQPIANSQTDMHINGWVWGPPCRMPRTGDTYLTFIPEVSQYKDETGFTGLVLRFATSEPGPDEVVPSTYC